MIASLVSIFVTLWQFITGLRRKDIGAQVADEANHAAKTSAVQARQTSAALNQELNRVQAQADVDVALVRAADSLREQRAAIEDAIRRANSDV